MILRTAEVLNCGVMALTIMENIKMDKSMVEEFTTGQMGQSMEVNGNKMKCMERENSSGLMVENTRVSSQWV